MRTQFATAMLLTGLALAGCGKNEVKVYHVGTDEASAPALPPSAPGMAMPSTMPAGLSAPDNSGLPALKYTLPPGWKEKELTQMRVASFMAEENGKSADISVIPMGGMAGGDLANVNRWLGQVGQAPITEADVPKLLEAVQIAGQPADMFDLLGTSPSSGAAERIIAAVLHREDTAWFFKITGDATLVEAQKSAFVSFLKSVEFAATAAPAAAMDFSKLPPSHPDVSGMNPPLTAGPAGDKPAWEIPAGWQTAEPGPMLTAKFSTANGEAKADVNISQLAGDGGGLLSNVTRWRAQLGLNPPDETELAGTVSMAGSVSVVDFSGTNAKTGKPARLVGAIVPHGGQTWFYKLMGDEAVVAAQKDAFLKFVQSARYPDAP